MLVAALQLAPAGASIPETVERILALVDKAGTAGVQLAVLPELALTPYFAGEVHDDLTPYTDVAQNAHAIEEISRRSSQYGMALVLPYAEQTASGLFNSMAFIHRNGHVAGTFRKVHIPGSVEIIPGKPRALEKRYFRPGDLGFGAYDVGDLKVGGLICYDRRFPESYRSLMLNGAEVIAVGYNTPVIAESTLSQSRYVSELSITAGAYFTGTSVIAAGKAGKENGKQYIGYSAVVGPDGVKLARARSLRDEVVIAPLDFAKQKRIRDRWAFSENRHPERYVMS